MYHDACYSLGLSGVFLFRIITTTTTTTTFLQGLGQRPVQIQKLNF
jgi:hypothetical protein